MASETARATKAEPVASDKSDQTATTAPSGPCPPTADSAPAQVPAHGFAALALGAVGVVFGDIGTSPLYAMREALRHSRAAEDPRLAVLGVVSLVVWTLTLIVTIKYIVFLMRADNRGEGGTLALMALAQRAVGRRTRTIFILGVAGAALFYGEGVITPAISVLSASSCCRRGARTASRPSSDRSPRSGSCR
jgi:KUP system potassium uptake protein